MKSHGGVRYWVVDEEEVFCVGEEESRNGLELVLRRVKDGKIVNVRLD